MALYASVRIVRALILLVGLSVVFFVIAHLTPGGICSLESDRSLSSCINGLGLRYSLPQQYTDWIGGYLHGNFGHTSGGQSVTAQILGGIPATGFLILGASLVVVVFNTIRVAFSSRRLRGRVDRLLREMGLIGLSFPTFWLAIVLIYVFAVHWQILPMGQVDSRNVPALWSHAWFSALSHSPRAALTNLVKHLALPAVTLATVMVLADTLTSVGPRTRSRRVLVGAGPARGLSRWTQSFVDDLRQLLPAAIGDTRRLMPPLITGVVIVESVFGYAGLGSLLYTSLGERDYATVQGLLMVGTLLLVVVTLAAQLSDRTGPSRAVEPAETAKVETVTGGAV